MKKFTPIILKLVNQSDSEYLLAKFLTQLPVVLDVSHPETSRVQVAVRSIHISSSYEPDKALDCTVAGLRLDIASPSIFSKTLDQFVALFSIKDSVVYFDDPIFYDIKVARDLHAIECDFVDPKNFVSCKLAPKAAVFVTLILREVAV